MDPLNDERTNVMTDRVAAFHESCVRMQTQSAAVLKRETKASMHYVRLADNFRKMSQGEANKKLRQTMQQIADTLSEIETHRESMVVAQMQRTLLKRLKELDETCNAPTTAMLKDRNSSVRSSVKLKDQFESLASKQTSQRKLDKKRAQFEDEERRVYTIDRGLQQNLLRYEHKRVHECKGMLEDYIKGQLLFHCRAVEAFSQALKSVRHLDASEAVEQLCSDLHISAKQVHRQPHDQDQ